MKICGTCGSELKCIKTGLTTHDTRYCHSSRHQADLFSCPLCQMLFLNRADGEYFDPNDTHLPECTIIEGITIQYSPEFKAKILSQYNIAI